MINRPGTVSKVLWHFTGGPRWNADLCKQEAHPKPAHEAHASLIAILQTGEIRLGGYRERFAAEVLRNEKNPTTGERTKTLKRITLETSRVVCVADIPLMHLAYHAQRYGRFAIGFSRQRLLNAGFNPVLYTLENRFLSAGLHRALSAIESVGDRVQNARWELDDFASEIESKVDDLKGQDGNAINHRINFSPYDAEWALDSIESEQETALKHMQEALAYVKTFTMDEFETIYCEREWRSTSPFRFSAEDVAMIVLPRECEGRTFWEEFLSHDVAKGFPRHIPLLAWEDVMEQ